ncbi:hypothetical protein RvY_14834 [Ramazzottius varieornatus]|uniref:Peroxiredoxin-5 n=1 Tax=Ramazzottius varieornatus TaxID=947166 RepID=A0A1D1VSP7_RAMVA|nr:hypothetical protein RvY_14834 [Ramazzottius varieornatus]
MFAARILSNSVVRTCARGPAGTRALHVTASLAIKEGDKLPNEELIEGQSTKIKLADLFGKKRGILIGVPGAFTPGCDGKHLPSYVDNFDELQKKGIEVIACIAVNDQFVMTAWANERQTEGKVHMLADPQAKVTKALKMEKDLAPLGGIRSKRFSMLIENGKVAKMFVEPDGVGVSCSLSDNMLEELDNRAAA